MGGGGGEASPAPPSLDDYMKPCRARSIICIMLRKSMPVNVA